MSSVSQTGLLLAVALLASLFVVPWDKVIPEEDGPAPPAQHFELASVPTARTDIRIHETDAALIGLDRSTQAGSSDDPDNWAAADHINAHVREESRAALLEQLAHPGPRWCFGAERKALTEAVRYYYEIRFRQIAAYAKRDASAKALAKAAWTSANDGRIERLIRDFVADGYLRPTDIPARFVPDLAQELRAVKPGSACPRKT